MSYIHSWKGRTHILGLAFLALFLTGCPEEKAPNEHAPARAQWTVLVYMNAKNNLFPFSLVNFQDMASVEHSSNINLVVEWGGYDWKKVYRILVKPNMSIAREPTSGKDGVSDIGMVDMGAVDTFNDFVKWGKVTYPAEHYMLIIWDHGQGYRLELANANNRLLPHATALAAPGGAQLLALPDSSSSGGTVSTYRSISTDEKTKHHLYNSDIQTVVEANKVDLIGFDACLMSMIETGYAVRRGASVMVGSEELEPGNGWKYDLWLTDLAKKPDASPEDVAQMVVSAYRNSYQNSFDGHTSTLSASRLSLMTDLAHATSALGDALTNAILSDPKSLSEIVNARTHCNVYAPVYTSAPGFSRFNYIDLYLFAGNLETFVTDPSVKRAAGALKGVLNQCSIVSWAGDSRNQPPWLSKGLSIYFPASGDFYQNDMSNPEFGNGYEKSNMDHPVEFVSAQDVHWSDFLHLYFAKVPHVP